MSLLLESRSYRQIGEVLGCSQGDIARARKVITEHGVTADPLAQLPQSRIGELFPDRRDRLLVLMKLRSSLRWWPRCVRTRISRC